MAGRQVWRANGFNEDRSLVVGVHRLDWPERRVLVAPGNPFFVRRWRSRRLSEHCTRRVRVVSSQRNGAGDEHLVYRAGCRIGFDSSAGLYAARTSALAMGVRRVRSAWIVVVYGVASLVPQSPRRA